MTDFVLDPFVRGLLIAVSQVMLLWLISLDRTEALRLRRQPPTIHTNTGDDDLSGS